MIVTATRRDVLILRGGENALVSAVDSCGGIGRLPQDALTADPELVGEFTARTALLEVLAVGAAPSCASAAVCNGPEQAERLLAGIRKALGNVPLVISTEKNMPTGMTALGVTVIGQCLFSALRLASSMPGDLLCCAGLPLVGPELLHPDISLPSPAVVRRLLEYPGVHAVIPVGSRGIAAEAAVLAAESGLRARLDIQAGVDLHKSAGPSSCLLFTMQADASPALPGLPVTVVGSLPADGRA